MGFLNFNSGPSQPAPPSLGGSQSSLGGGYIPSWQVNAQPSFLGNATASGGGGGPFSFLGRAAGSVGNGIGALTHGIGMLLNRPGGPSAPAPAPVPMPSISSAGTQGQQAMNAEGNFQLGFQNQQAGAWSRFYRPDELHTPDGPPVSRVSPASGAAGVHARDAYLAMLKKTTGDYSTIPGMIAANQKIASGQIPKFGGG